MGIRDTSYYGWDSIGLFGTTPQGLTSSFYDMYADEGAIYAVGEIGINVGSLGSNDFLIKKSSDEGVTWEDLGTPTLPDNNLSRILAVQKYGDTLYIGGFHTINSTITGSLHKSTDEGKTWTLVVQPLFDESINFIAVDSSGNVAAQGGTGTLFSSSDNGDTWGYQNLAGGPNANGHGGVVVDSQDNFYWSINDSPGTNLQLIYKSTNSGSTWSSIANRANNSVTSPGTIGIGPDDTVYVSTGTTPAMMSSSDGGTTFGTTLMSDVGVAGIALSAFSMAKTLDDMYFSLSGKVVRTSNSGSSWEHVGNISEGALKMRTDPQDNIYMIGTKFPSGPTFVRRGKLTANSSSFGPTVFAPSIGYVAEEPLTSSLFSGSAVEKFKLMNISEFSHAGGAFQMPGIILGTTDSGQVGDTEDNIIQISHLGSVVHIMWPQQNEGIESFVQGFGSFAPGQRPGKLLPTFTTGSFFDVTEFDHLALYGFVTKALSGTLDNVDVRVERRPLRDTPFAIDQAIEYSISGSDALATYRDLVHTKEIDYGDLDISEIGWPMDIPLTNVKELRISARHRIGQSDDLNKNFIVWGRLIKSEEET